jgi:hypothetical protein
VLVFVQDAAEAAAASDVWFQIKVLSSSSCRQVCTHRSMIEFMRGARMPLRITSTPASARTASESAGNLLSRSRIRNRA